MTYQKTSLRLNNAQCGHKLILSSFFSRQNVTISKKIRKTVKTFQFPCILLQIICKKFFFQIQNDERCNLMRITIFCISTWQSVDSTKAICRLHIDKYMSTNVDETFLFFSCLENFSHPSSL